MIASSNEWKNLYENVEEELLPESDIRIINTDDVLAPIPASNVQTSAFMSGYTERTDVATCSRSETMNEPTKKLATAEWNSFVLDGSFTLWKDGNDTVREFASGEICDENCNFANPPYIAIVNLKRLGQAGVCTNTFRTIKFATNRNEYAKSITFKTISFNPKNTAETSENQFSHNDLIYDIDYIVQWAGSLPSGYYVNNAYLYINKWSKPYRRARVFEYRIGKRFLWNRDNIMETVRYNKSVDMVNAELPQNDVEFQFYDPNNDFDKWNTSAAFANAFNANSKFLINCGYLINGVWEWKKTDTLYFRELSRPSNSLSATLKLENNVQKMTQVIPKFKLTKELANQSNPSDLLPNKWTNYGQFISVLNNVSNKKINIDSSVINKVLTTTDYNTLCYPYTGMLILERYERKGEASDTKAQVSRKRLWKEYFTTPCNQLLQMACQIVTSFILIRADGEINIRSLCNQYGELKAKSNLSIKDTIKLKEMYEYPEIEQLETIDKICFSTLLFADGDIFFREKNAINQIIFSYSSSGTVQSLQNNLLFYKEVYDGDKTTEVPTTYFFKKNSGLHPAKYASQYVHDMISRAIKITANTIINPLWEMGDFIGVETKNGADIKTYQGFLINMDMEYAGTFKGKVTILVPKSYQ